MATKKTIKKKTAKKETKSMNDEKKYVVIMQNRSGQVDYIYLVDSKETGKKHSIIENLGEDCDKDDEPGYEELKENLLKLIREDKWKEVFKIWDEEGMDGYEWKCMTLCCELNEAKDLKTLWVYDKDYEDDEDYEDLAS